MVLDDFLTTIIFPLLDLFTMPFTVLDMFVMFDVNGYEVTFLTFLIGLGFVSAFISALVKVSDWRSSK